MHILKQILVNHEADREVAVEADATGGTPPLSRNAALQFCSQEEGRSALWTLLALVTNGSP